MLQQLMLMLFVPLVLGPIQLNTEAPKKKSRPPPFSTVLHTLFTSSVRECKGGERERERERESLCLCMKSLVEGTCSCMCACVFTCAYSHTHFEASSRLEA
jgi:hypothetical protein